MSTAADQLADAAASPHGGPRPVPLPRGRRNSELAMLGFAVLHALTQGLRGRTAMLSGAYAFVVVLGWPALVAVLVGLGESIFHWRDRMPQHGPPVAPQS